MDEELKKILDFAEVIAKENNIETVKALRFLNEDFEDVEFWSNKLNRKLKNRKLRLKKLGIE
ncbi:hypothetical protein AB4370_22020 [Vibrio cyclitrophicus]